MRTTRINVIRKSIWKALKKKYNQDEQMFANWGIINEAIYLAIQITEWKLNKQEGTTK